ncbi:UvrB/UvrC motif-containing protein [Sphingomonas aerolata]
MQAKLGAQMQAAAESMDFELAALLRDQLKALTFIQGTQAINAEGVGDADIFAMACKDGLIGIQAFFIRGGQGWGIAASSAAHQRRARGRGADQLPRPVLRGRAARAADPARPRAARRRAAG